MFTITVTSCKDCPYRRSFNWGSHCILKPDSWALGWDFVTIPKGCPKENKL